METKKRTANEIVVFFKTFLVSIPVGIILFLVLFNVWEINYYKNPEMKGVYDMNYDWSYSDYGYTIKGGAFGSYKNMTVYNKYYKYLPTTKEEMYRKVLQACNMWVEEKTQQSILLSVLSVIGIPVLFIILRIVYRLIRGSYQWVQENKTT